MQYLRCTYPKKKFLVYLKFKLNWHPVFYLRTLNLQNLCVCDGGGGGNGRGLKGGSAMQLQSVV